MNIPDWLWLILMAGVVFVTRYVVVWAVIGFFWRFGPKIRFPRREILIVAVVISLPTVIRDFANFRQQIPDEQLATEAAALNAAFLAAFDFTASRDEVRTMVSAVALDRWPADLRDAIISSIVTKANRYGDLHQSMLLGRVVRTPLPSNVTHLEDFRSTDEAVWTPVLAAAARGEPASLPDIVIDEPEEAWFMAVTAARARIILQDAVRSEHGIEQSLVDADRDLSNAFDWIEGYARATRGDTEYEAFLQTLAVLTEASSDGFSTEGAVQRILEAAQRHPDLARSFLLSAWATEYVDLSTHRWLARVALDEQPPTTITRLNTYRRLLGLPTLLQEVASDARSAGHVPSWPGGPAHLTTLPPLEVLAWVDQELRQLDERHAEFGGFWSPPAIDLN